MPLKLSGEVELTKTTENRWDKASMMLVALAVMTTTTYSVDLFCGLNGVETSQEWCHWIYFQVVHSMCSAFFTKGIQEITSKKEEFNMVKK